MGAIQAKVAEEEAPEVDLQLLSDVNDLILALEGRKIETLVVKLPVAEMIVKNNPELIITEEKVKDTEDGSAVEIQKNQEALVGQMNSTINRIKEEKLLDQFIVGANELAEKQE